MRLVTNAPTLLTDDPWQLGGDLIVKMGPVRAQPWSSAPPATLIIMALPQDAGRPGAVMRSPAASRAYPKNVNTDMG